MTCGKNRVADRAAEPADRPHQFARDAVVHRQLRIRNRLAGAIRTALVAPTLFRQRGVSVRELLDDQVNRLQRLALGQDTADARRARVAGIAQRG